MAKGLGKVEAIDPEALARFGLDGFNGYRASLFPFGAQREQLVTSRLLATLEVCAPFARAFFDQVGVDGPPRRASRRREDASLALLEPTFTSRGSSSKGSVRADGAMSFRRRGPRYPRFAFEVKYLSTAKGSETKPARFTRHQVEKSHRAARDAKFDHLITVSAAEWDGEHHPSGYSPRTNSRVGLWHISWLGVLRAIQKTLREGGGSLSEVERRMLVDFERYLRTSEIWLASRKISLGKEFTAVRNASQAGKHGNRKSLSSRTIVPVAKRWVRLTETLANILALTTGLDVAVVAKGNRRPIDVAEQLIKEHGQLRAFFASGDPRLGSTNLVLDLCTGVTTAEWTVSVDALTGSPNSQRKTRWRAIETALETALGESVLAKRGRYITVEGPKGSGLLLDRVGFNLAFARFADEEFRQGVPTRLTIAGPKWKERPTSSNVASLAERAVRHVTPW